MTQRTDHDAEVEEKFWKTLDDTRIGMLGLMNGERSRHLQPMTAFGDPDANTLWFFTNRHTDLAKDVGAGSVEGMFTLVAKDRKLWACVAGRLSEQLDRERIETYWNPVVSAWYPEGKDDPNLTLLRFELIDAEIWLDEGGPLKLAWEVAKANITKNLPDEGSRAHLNFQ